MKTTMNFSQQELRANYVSIVKFLKPACVVTNSEAYVGHFHTDWEFLTVVVTRIKALIQSGNAPLDLEGNFFETISHAVLSDDVELGYRICVKTIPELITKGKARD
jgi:hypothetical protein